jgi:hypothetical protein
LAALFHSEGDFVSGGFHAPIFCPQNPFVNMRTFICYMILGC